jgi:hypothetical protein
MVNNMSDASGADGGLANAGQPAHNSAHEAKVELPQMVNTDPAAAAYTAGGVRYIINLPPKSTETSQGADE